MGNINIEMNDYLGDVIGAMLKRGYAKTKTEALRLAVYEFDRTHSLTEDAVFELAAEKMLSDIKSGKEKVRKFNPHELD
ncbi:MAG: hypothetical protein WC263_00510 [Candidatus Micrarchaeia archaeon]|jgi:hypothetical protein